jgi:hypothetical protein
VTTAHPGRVDDGLVLENLHNNQSSLVRDVITLPLRLGACAARLGLDITADVVGATLKATWRLVEAHAPLPHNTARNDRASSDEVRLDIMVVAPRDVDATPSTSPERAQATATTETSPEPADAPPPAPADAQPAQAAAAEIPPAHVSEELQFVESFAEPGAEEGAGAAVHVMEPWHGYREMTANGIIERLDDASSEELAAVVLYEGGHRGRLTVIAEARRRLTKAAAATPGQFQ